MTATELPRCAVCRTTIRPAENVVFRTDGRVHHVACPEVICPICSCQIMPHDPIRRDGDVPVHGNCWMRRLRSASASDGNARRVAIIRGRLRVGMLPSDAPTKIWSGYGSGQLCDACGERIAVGAPEDEVVFTHSVTLRFHQGCFALWQEEKTRRNGGISGGSAASPWTLFFDLGIARRASRDRVAYAEVRAATAETLMTVTETLAMNQAVRARARVLRKAARSACL